MLPAEYRDALIKGGGTGTFWLTCFFDHLEAYLPADWEDFTEQLNQVPFPSRQLSHFKTKIIGLAQDLIPDAQGRVRIPQSLMREAGLQKDVMLVGMHSRRFQLWDQNRFDALTFGDVSEELAAAGVDITSLP